MLKRKKAIFDFCRMVDVNNTSNNSSVLGLSSGHGSGNSVANSASGAVVGAAGGGLSGAANAGMTSDLMGATAQSGDRLDASSDSAVSSMGSERVPSLSDGEWGEGSDSAQDYHHSKYGGPYDYSYNNGTRLNDGTRQPPVAQKKHQMFGKRAQHETIGGAGVGVAGTTAVTGDTSANGFLHGAPAAATSIKYEYDPTFPTLPVVGSNAGIGLQQHGSSIDGAAIGPLLTKEQQAYELKYGGANAGAVGGGYSLDYSIRPPRSAHEMVQHNHTYTLPQGSGSLPRPQQRDKKHLNGAGGHVKSITRSLSISSNMTEEEHLTRDEKRARALSIPIPVCEIINLPMDEFNERLSKYDLNENQLSLIRDIRRRGKNKVAAQNCRKRKLDQILTLEDEVKEVRRRKEQLLEDRDTFGIERKRISNKFAALHRHIFQYLRDADGNPCSPSEYSLQQASDGSIYLLPREGAGIKAENSNNTDVNNTHNNVAGTHLNGHHHQQQQQHTAIAASAALHHTHQQQHQHHQQQQQQHALAQQQLHHQQQTQQQQQQQQHTHHQTHRND